MSLEGTPIGHWRWKIDFYKQADLDTGQVLEDHFLKLPNNMLHLPAPWNHQGGKSPVWYLEHSHPRGRASHLFDYRKCSSRGSSPFASQIPSRAPHSWRPVLTNRPAEPRVAARTSGTHHFGLVQASGQWRCMATTGLARRSQGFFGGRVMLWLRLQKSGQGWGFYSLRCLGSRPALAWLSRQSSLL